MLTFLEPIYGMQCFLTASLENTHFNGALLSPAHREILDEAGVDYSGSDFLSENWY